MTDNAITMPNAIGQPGVYSFEQIPMRSYLADDFLPSPSLSSGIANTIITRSPLHAWQAHPRFGASPENEPDSDHDSDAATVGQIAHSLLCGGDGKICVIEPSEYRSAPKRKGEEGSIPKGWTNNAIRDARDEAISNGLLPVLPKQMAAAKRMEIAARYFVMSTELRGLFDAGAGEATAVAKLGDTWLRARPDWMNEQARVVLHYKTTRASANPETFIRGIMIGSGYDVSLSFYRFVLEALSDEFREWSHVILAQEQMPPYACSLITLDPAMWAIADDKVARAIELWQRCMASGKWPAYSPALHYASPTAWQLAQAEESRQSGV